MVWFAKNAAAIQAIASIVGVLITAALAAITYWYVRVTSRIAESSAEQVRQIREAARITQQRNARNLGGLAAHIRKSLGSLDADAPRTDQINAFTQITENDVSSLLGFALQLDNPAILSQCNTAVAAVHEIFATIRWVGEYAAKWEMPNDRKGRWRTARQDSDRSLHAVEVECERQGNPNP